MLPFIIDSPTFRIYPHPQGDISPPLKAMSKNNTIYRQVITVFLSILVLILVSIACSTTVALSIKTKALADLENNLIEAHKTKLQVAVHTVAVTLGEAIKDIDSINDKINTLRDLTEEIRFEEDQSGYYFIYNHTTALSVPAKPTLHGKDLDNAKDANGVYFVRGLYEQARNGGGFIQYIFAKPDQGNQPKLAYCEMIPGSDMWVGTGVYIDNVERES